VARIVGCIFADFIALVGFFKLISRDYRLAEEVSTMVDHPLGAVVLVMVDHRLAGVVLAMVDHPLAGVVLAMVDHRLAGVVLAMVDHRLAGVVLAMVDHRLAGVVLEAAVEAALVAAGGALAVVGTHIRWPVEGKVLRTDAAVRGTPPRVLFRRGVPAGQRAIIAAVLLAPRRAAPVRAVLRCRHCHHCRHCQQDQH